jgi:tetratricopeptide (TPR) repeat protein
MRPTHPGKLVAGRFEVGQVAGSGGMGIVYQATDLETGRPVALKVLLERDQGPSDRFAHEVELLSRLDHAHIVGYVSHGVTSEGAPFLVMPWLDGVDLETRLREKCLSIDETLALARRVADALAYLHGQGLVHRDLKPSNLFLPDGKVEDVKLIDLGVARQSIPSAALTISGVLIGTPGFIAPEQARADREVAPSVDIFALGCVLFECLTGRRLFNGTHLMSVLAKILLEDAPRVSELRPDAPLALDLLVHRMVAKDPERRPRDGSELKRWLGDLHRTLEIEANTATSSMLTESERRIVTVLVVVLASGRGSLRPPGPETRVDADPFQASSARFGVKAHLLAERTVIAVAQEKRSANDQAAVLTRFAQHVVETFPGARVVLTTGSALTGGRLPVGEAIDRAVTMVRGSQAARGVQIDEVTASLITARFDVRREDGVLRVYEERLALDPTRPLLGKPTSCVGRERELSMMEATFADCAQGDGPEVILVTAPAGVGKSRLRHEFVRRLQGGHPSPIRILHALGDPLHSATPYALAAQLVRQAAGLHERQPVDVVRARLWAHVSGIVSEAHASRVNDFLGELVGTTFDDGGDLPLRAARQDAGAMSDQIGRAFEDIVRAWSQTDPLVLVLDDFHFSDAPSMKLIDRALRKLGGSKVFALVLARPEVHERFSPLFPRLAVVEIRLPPIPKRACTKLVHEVVGENAPPEDIAKLVERSEGNGFYLEELIRAAAEDGSRGRSKGSLLVDHLPESVIAVAQARLERLDPAVRKVLRAASIFGDAFAFDGVRALVGIENSALEAIVNALVEQEVVFPSENPRLAGAREFVFRHNLMRGTAYAMLTHDDRALGHRLAAGWLEHVEEDDEIVAAHWLEGGERTLAAQRFTSASEARWRRAQADAAARCAARALLVSRPLDEPGEAIADRIEKLARSLEASRSIDAPEVLSGLETHVPAVDSGGGIRGLMHAALHPSIESLRQRGENDLLARVLVRASCALAATADFAGAKKLLGEASSLATEGSSASRIAVQAAAKVAFWAGETGRAIELLAESVLPEDPRARLDSLLLLAVAVVTVDGRAALVRGLDYIARGEAILEAQALEVDGAHSSQKDPVGTLVCLRARYLCLCFSGEYSLAVKAAEEAVSVARSAGLRFDLMAHLHNAGEQYLRFGEMEKARGALLESNEIARDIAAERNQKHNDVLLAYLDAEDARLYELAEGARVTGDPWLELFASYWLGHLLASKRRANASEALQRSLGLARELKQRTMADECEKALKGLAQGSPLSS